MLIWAYEDVKALIAVRIVARAAQAMVWKVMLCGRRTGHLKVLLLRLANKAMMIE